MRHRIVGCVLFFAFTRVHALEATDVCTGPLPNDWERLSAPPPDSEQMLAITLKPDPRQSAGTPVQSEAWFQSKSGAFRFCRYRGATDRCYAIADYLDFQLRSGHWYVASAGGISNCPSYPQKCRAAPITESTDARLNGKSLNTPAGQPVALRHIVDRLSEKWTPPSRDVYMAIALQK